MFPTRKAYETRIKAEEAASEEYAEFGDGEKVVFFKQTINSVRGLYAILHAQLDGDGKRPIDLGSMAANEDVMSSKCTSVIGDMMAMVDRNANFRLMRLVEKGRM